MQSFPTAVPYLPTDPAILLPRCARSACLNRSPLTLPYLARLLGPSFTPTADTLGAVLEIAARGRRWNTVRGALSLARIIQQRYFHPLHIHNDTLTRDTSPRVALLSADLDIQHRRRHFVPNGEDSFGSTRMLHISMVANVVANYGGQLDVGFF
ncbi:hypothetical protein BC829DRAFT_111167 [Chytridium lagenaria]|nr:hypothetical protein BC829DRAFT_111167 [Chytridium lagenaria]